MPQLPGAQGAPYGLISGPVEPSRYANLKTVLSRPTRLNSLAYALSWVSS